MYRARLRRLAIFVFTFACPWFAAGLNFAVQDEAQSNSQKLTVHEWGTFTELQNEHGKPLTGINTDDEPVPEFVHGFGEKVLNRTFFPNAPNMKSIPYRHHQIIARLETPVVYFYPPEGAEPMTVDVQVRLRDGWLSEYYPNATVDAPGIKQMKIQSGEYSALQWNQLKICTDGIYPETPDPVWLNPRATRAATVTAESGESEKYLFYRGVGNFSGPVKTSINRESGKLTIASKEPNDELAKELAAAWLVHVNHENEVAFQSLGKIALPPEGPVTSTQYRFPEKQFGTENLARLKMDMHRELVKDGLYSDEASAMLATWNRAYFHTPGLRLFYLVPRQWTDDRMPLDVSVPISCERVMMGRVELISDETSKLVKKIKSFPKPDAGWYDRIPKSEARKKFFAGRSDFGDLGIKIPRDYQAYLDLGRFRNAILRAEQDARPTRNLYHFLRLYGLNPPKFSPNDLAADRPKNKKIAPDNQ